MKGKALYIPVAEAARIIGVPIKPIIYVCAQSCLRCQMRDDVLFVRLEDVMSCAKDIVYLYELECENECYKRMNRELSEQIDRLQKHLNELTQLP